MPASSCSISLRSGGGTAAGSGVGGMVGSGVGRSGSGLAVASGGRLDWTAAGSETPEDADGTGRGDASLPSQSRSPRTEQPASVTATTRSRTRRFMRRSCGEAKVPSHPPAHAERKRNVSRRRSAAGTQLRPTRRVGVPVSGRCRARVRNLNGSRNSRRPGGPRALHAR